NQKDQITSLHWPIEEEIFNEDIPDGSIPYYTIQLTAPINSQRKSAQGGSETCSFCNEPDLLFELDEANLKPVDDDTRLNPQEEEDRVKKFFKELFKRLQDFNPLLILKEKTCEVFRIEYEILDSHYPLRKALEKKLAEFTSIHPLQTARILLNTKIKQQFSSDISRNIFNKKKRSAKNIYNIFKTEGLGRVEIKRIRRISPLSFGKFTDKEIKIIQERVRVNSS
ncbi:13595_t:CDS:2, partial [Funneliformis caledonium]